MSKLLNPEAITALIRHRRSMKPKCFSNLPVAPSVLNQILSNACWAPSHGMTQPWRFTVFTGRARERLADFLAGTYQDLVPKESFRSKKYESLLRNPTLAPVVIAVGMKRQPSEKISELDETMAVACAVQNLHLTATAFGLGGFWSTNVAATSDAMAEMTGLSPPDRALGLFYLGYPAGRWPESKRDPLDSKVQFLDE